MAASCARMPAYSTRTHSSASEGISDSAGSMYLHWLGKFRTHEGDAAHFWVYSQARPSRHFVAMVSLFCICYMCMLLTQTLHAPATLSSCMTSSWTGPYSLNILASLSGMVSMVPKTCPSARSAAHCTLAGASPFCIIACTEICIQAGLCL